MVDKDGMKYGDRISDVRRGLGLSQAQFCTRFGLRIGTLRDWEQGRSQPSAGAKAWLDHYVLGHPIVQADRRAYHQAQREQSYDRFLLRCMLRGQMKVSGLSLAEAARNSRIKKRTISDALDEKEVLYSDFLRLARWLGCSPQDFLSSASP